MNWTQTRSGAKWSLLDPKAENVNFAEIAYILSHLPRFNAHTKVPYSVAEHSVHIHDELRRGGFHPMVCLLGLLHDAHEAYIGDIITPVASALAVLCEEIGGIGDGFVVSTAIRKLKADHDIAIFEAAGLDQFSEDHDATAPTRRLAVSIVKRADAAAMMRERDVLMLPPPEPWAGGLEDLPRALFTPEGWDADFACQVFTDRLDFYLSMPVIATRQAS
jgi:hypothetical protein